MRDNRRVYARVNLNLSFEYENLERSHPDKLVNLSAGGAYILTKKPLKKSKQITIRFILPEFPKKMIRARATVLWSTSQEKAKKYHPMGMGIQFDLSDKDLFHLLDQYISVTTGLKTVDPRIGKELPHHIRKEIAD